MAAAAVHGRGARGHVAAVSRASAIGFEHDVRGHLTGASRLGA